MLCIAIVVRLAACQDGWIAIHLWSKRSCRTDSILWCNAGPIITIERPFIRSSLHLALHRVHTTMQNFQ
jgi:hypothetical protein